MLHNTGIPLLMRHNETAAKSWGPLEGRITKGGIMIPSLVDNDSDESSNEEGNEAVEESATPLQTTQRRTMMPTGLVHYMKMALLKVSCGNNIYICTNALNKLLEILQ